MSRISSHLPKSKQIPFRSCHVVSQIPSLTLNQHPTTIAITFAWQRSRHSATVLQDPLPLLRWLDEPQPFVFFEGLREVGDSSCNELGELQNPCLVKSWLTAHFFRWTSQLLSLKRKMYKNSSPNLDLFSASRSDDRLGTRSRQKLCFLLYLYVHMVATGNK